MSTSSSSAEFVVPAGQYPPYAVVTDTDHTAWILVATVLGLACSLIFGGIRAFVRSTICPGLGLDDAFLAGATIITIIQSSVLIGACSDGFGKSIELVASEVLAKVQKLYYTSTLLFVIALGLSKLSIVFFLLRLAVAHQQRRLLKALGAFIAAWTVAAVFAVTLQCNLTHPWIVAGESCSGAFVRWQVICAFDIITEICIIGLSILLVWGLHNPLGTKIAVVSTFAWRFLMIVPIAFRLSNYDRDGRSSNPTLLEDLFAVWTQTELNYSLISATIPSLRPFVNKLNTQFGGIGEGENSYGYGYSKGSSTNPRSNGSFQMRSLRSVFTSRNREDTKIRPINFTGKPDAYSYDIYVPSSSNGTDANQSQINGNKSTLQQRQVRKENGDATSVGSDDSQQLIIRKEITYEVERPTVP